VIDVLMVAAKAQVESQNPTVTAAICANLCHVNATGEGFIALTGPAVSSMGWAAQLTCWVDGAVLATEAAGLIVAATFCGVSTLAPPAAIACIVAWCCGFANFLARLMIYSSNCLGQSPISPEAIAIIHVFEVMTGFCSVLLGGPTLSVATIKSFVREIMRIMRPI